MRVNIGPICYIINSFRSFLFLNCLVFGSIYADDFFGQPYTALDVVIAQNGDFLGFQ